MLRLLQGDVGSGKTAVAAYALAAAARAGLQGALLAPTDLLARQHLETLGGAARGRSAIAVDAADRLADSGRRHGQGARARSRRARRRSSSGPTRSSRSAVAFADLGLVVIDEQHRFGVEQRGQLEAKAGGRAPHVLLMTATPIPRTLGQVLYADLDVSDLRTPPAGRIPIRTGHPPAGRPRRDVAEGPRGGGARAPDVRRRAADRGGGGADDGGDRRVVDASRRRERGRPPDRAARAAPGRDGPRPDQARRPRRRDGAGSATASSTSSSARPSSRSASTCRRRR